MGDYECAIERLQEQRPRKLFVHGSLATLTALAAYAWIACDCATGELVGERHLSNVSRFIREALPYPLQGEPWDWSVAFHWFSNLLSKAGWNALTATVAISILAIVLAMLGATVLAVPAARTLAAPAPYLPHSSEPCIVSKVWWRMVVVTTRGLSIFLRAVPEYVWAFMLIGVMGPTYWTAIVALALHNCGVLAKLLAEMIENLPDSNLAAIRALGARRWQIAAAAVLPAINGRALLLMFYRWESCVREATVLGMLGIVSIGFFVQDARARQHYDVMLAFVFLGSVLVSIVDVLSAATREALRRA